MNLIKLRTSINNNSIEWSKHVLQRMFTRGVYRNDIKFAILNGEMIEDYPEDKPYPSVLIYCLVDNVPIHVVVALDEERIKAYIITVYEPSQEIFESDNRTRRKL
jgi:hypothetical protein